MISPRILVNASAVFAFVSAAMWLYAAFGIKYNPLTFGGWGDGTTERQFVKQGRFNGYAAAAAGVSALLQGISAVAL
jgi:hypothetical protein